MCISFRMNVEPWNQTHSSNPCLLHTLRPRQASTRRNFHYDFKIVMNPQDPNFRQVVEDVLDLGQLWARLGLPPDPQDWQPGDSEYVQGLFADKGKLSKALGFDNARCLTPEEAAHEAEDRSTKLFEHW